VIDQQAFAPRVTRRRARPQHVAAQIAPRPGEGEMEEEWRRIVGRLETFAAQGHHGRHQADVHTRREIMRSLGKRVEVD
jgi:site-specific DNA recombinase